MQSRPIGWWIFGRSSLRLSCRFPPFRDTYFPFISIEMLLRTYNINLPTWRPAIQFAENRRESMCSPLSQEREKESHALSYMVYENFKLAFYRQRSLAIRRCTCERCWVINDFSLSRQKRIGITIFALLIATTFIAKEDS